VVVIGGFWVNQAFPINEKGCQNSTPSEWNSEAIKLLDFLQNFEFNEAIRERKIFFTKYDYGIFFVD